MLNKLNQPKGSTSLEVTKESIARRYNCLASEVLVIEAGAEISDSKVLLDIDTMRSYPLPNNIPDGTTIMIQL